MQKAQTKFKGTVSNSSQLLLSLSLALSPLLPPSAAAVGKKVYFPLSID
jgi:hypothetical protein